MKLVPVKMDLWPKSFDDCGLESIVDNHVKVNYDKSTIIKIDERIVHPGLYISGGDYSRQCKTLIENGKVANLSEGVTLWPDYNDKKLAITSIDEGDLKGLAIKYDPKRIVEKDGKIVCLGVYHDPKTAEYGKICLEKIE